MPLVPAVMSPAMDVSSVGSRQSRILTNLKLMRMESKESQREEPQTMIESPEFWTVLLPNGESSFADGKHVLFVEQLFMNDL